MTKNFSNVLNMNNWGLNSVYIQTKHRVSTRTSNLGGSRKKEIYKIIYFLYFS